VLQGSALYYIISDEMPVELGEHESRAFRYNFQPCV